MGNLNIPDPDDELRASLSARAAEHGRTVEEEAEEILREATGTPARVVTGADLLRSIRAIVDEFGGFELELPPRDGVREPPDFSR